ncbi:hypothetical protein ASG87_18460 [Frateuria sp. Soil773]|uniref:hypothetical protein n=1 Tax=Frateuria sp. Soil773 TaxID=1736407 RepID=UPI0006FC112F|nr:hypothetical protein [Frateuria sp. Soil773]KRE91598.1 hypothetical protein ASG87_18460 [Frateuria sp. Soil773]
MNIPKHPGKLILGILAASLLATAACAQTAGKPLNLKLPARNDLPPSDLPASSASTSKPAKDAPGVYYGDTSGRMGNTEVAADDRPHCDDATYNQPQVHGSVGMGVVSGNRIGTGTYQGGTVNLSQAFGSCDHPSGGMSISIGGTTGRFHGR